MERVTRQEARWVMQKVDGGLATEEPFFAYLTFNDSSIDFELIVKAVDYLHHRQVHNQLIKRIHARYNKEKIVIPFPIRTLELSGALAKKMS